MRSANDYFSVNITPLSSTQSFSCVAPDDALEGEFAVASALIKARGNADLARDFNDLVQKQVAADPAYAEALLDESVDTMLAGEGKLN